MTRLERLKYKMILRLIVITGGRWGGREKGLCSKLGLSVYRSNKLLGPHLKTWKSFSGSINYPVPHPRFIPNKERAESIYQGTYDLYHGRYGKLRIDLAKHLIRSL